MKNSGYFQPMVHRPLPDIRKYALLTNQNSEFYAVVKPFGLDVYINKGKIYDFHHNQLENSSLDFHFEKLLQTSVNMQMTIVGVLTSPNQSKDVMSYRLTLYGKTKSTFNNLTFVAYDTVFPTFNADHDFKLRFDIAEKCIGVIPNCKVAAVKEIKTERDLEVFALGIFSIDTKAEILVYRKDGKYVPGPSQLYYDDWDTVSYRVAADQRYRAHIKKVVSVTHCFPNGNKIELANHIVAKFKHDYIDIPIDENNISLRKFIWDHRIDLRPYPFWFTGYTLYDEGKYVTIVNSFKSFITP